MRKRKYLVGALVAVFAVGATGTALAAISQTAKVKTFPKTLKKAKRKNIALNVVTTTADPAAPSQTPSPAVKALVNFDDEFQFKPGVVGGTCTTGEISGQDTATARTTCASSIVGGGAAQVFVPTGPSHIVYDAEITAFNGPTSGGKPTIILYSYVADLSYGQPLTGVLKNSTAGKDYAKVLDVTIPLLPLGAALTKFDVTVGNPNSGRPGHTGYVKAKCGDKNKRINIKAKFTYQNGTSKSASSNSKCRA